MVGSAQPEVGFVSTGGVLPGLVASTVGYHDVGPAQPLHRGLPSPYLTFIFSLADPIVTGETTDHATGPDAWQTSIIVGGLHQRPAFIVPDDYQYGIQLAVHPLAARAIFGVSTAELTALVSEGADVLGDHAERLRQRLAAEESWPARFAVLQGFLRTRVEVAGRRSSPRAELAEAWRWLAWHRGDGSMAGLARHVALSPRQLTQVFVRELGVGPKQVARLMRFHHAVQLIAAAAPSGELDLSGVAARAGFFDHAHLDRDFAQFAGISPTGWLDEERRNIQAGGHRNGEDWTA